jgi:calcineurin-like phosphoesterase family protein
MRVKDYFYKQLKVKHDPEDILAWGCMHYDHSCDGWIKKGKKALWQLRGFNTLEDHNRALIDNWNAKANEFTIGFLLGDVMFGVGGKEKFCEFLVQLNFDTLYVMSGNHAAGWKQAFEFVEGNELTFANADGGSKKVIFVPNYLEAFVNGQPIVFSHYPILSWNGQGKGSWMLFSHVHGSLEKTEIGRLYTGGEFKCYETSVEKNEYPINFAELKVEMAKRNSKTPDHHDKETQNAF